MATGIRKNAEVAVRSGVKYILFMEGEDEIYESIDEYLKSLKPLPSPYLVNGKLSGKAKKGKKILRKTVRVAIPESTIRIRNSIR